MPETKTNTQQNDLRVEKIQLGVASGLLAGLLVLVSVINDPISVPTQFAAAASATKTERVVQIPPAFKNVTLSAKAAYVLDLSTGRVLYEKDADAQLPLASITKVALALVVSETLSRDQLIRIPQGGVGGIKAGEKWRVGDILDYTLVASSNEGAAILADAADESIRSVYSVAPAGTATLWRMNGFVHSIGLESMFFLNPSGLDESATQAGAFGSAHDVAELFAYAFGHEPEVFAATAKDGVLISTPDGTDTAVAYNTNESVKAIPGLLMGKTGYTDLAGGNLGIVFKADASHTIVAVVLGSTKEGRFSDMQSLVDASIATIRSETSAR